MSESSDDAQPLAAKDELAPGAVAAEPDDDVEVTADEALPTVESAPPPRHDSVQPTSRKLAPPPKPKRDSSHPSSRPPPAGEAVALGSFKPPSAPAISYQEGSASSRDVVAAALAGSDSLRTIGEALAGDAGAFSANEAPTGERPKVPRPRSQAALAAVNADSPMTRPSAELAPERTSSTPPGPRDKVATIPDDPASSSKAGPKSSSVFAQRIIAVGIHSDRPPPPPPPPEAEAEAIRSYEPVPPLPPPAQVEAAPDIPITTDEYDEDTPTAPSASPMPLAPEALVAAPAIPAEPTPAPPPLAPSAIVERAEQLSDEDVGPDSTERVPVEELSREDSPSLPPDEPTPAAPPPAPSARAEGKAPPPPPKRLGPAKS